MTLHFQECLDLADCKVLPISQSDDLVKGAEKLVCILQDLSFIQRLACACDNLCEEVEGINVLEDVGLTVGDEDHVEFVERLVHKTDIILFDSRMLSSGVCKLRKGCKQSFNSRTLHLTKLSGKNGFTAPRAD